MLFSSLFLTFFFDLPRHVLCEQLSPSVSNLANYTNTKESSSIMIDEIGRTYSRITVKAFLI